VIVFDSVSKRYPDGTRALEAFDLAVPAGRVTALVGPLGSGKTTALKLVNALKRPTSGTVRLGVEAPVGGGCHLVRFGGHQVAVALEASPGH
jgi:osmoprotectant transport system ATP-binding protein